MAHITTQPRYTADQVRDARTFAANPARYADLPQTCFDDLRSKAWEVLKADHLRRVRRRKRMAAPTPGDAA